MKTQYQHCWAVKTQKTDIKNVLMRREKKRVDLMYSCLLSSVTKMSSPPAFNSWCSTLPRISKSVEKNSSRPHSSRLLSLSVSKHKWTHIHTHLRLASFLLKTFLPTLASNFCILFKPSQDPFLLNFAPIISLEMEKLGTSKIVCWLIHRSTSTAWYTYYPKRDVWCVI